MPKSYIMFEGSQYDSYSYLFHKPTFISLDPAAKPGSIVIKGMRIGVNGAEAQSGQAYANVNTTVTDANYSATTGQLLSEVGTVDRRCRRARSSDQFFLSFEQIGTQTNVRTEPTPVTQPPVDLPPQSDIGMRTYEQLNQSMSRVTGVPTTNAGVRGDLPAGAAAAAAGAQHRGLPGLEPDRHRAAGHQVLLGDGRYAGRPRGLLPGAQREPGHAGSAQFGGAEQGHPGGAVAAERAAAEGRWHGPAPRQPTDSDVRTELNSLIDKLVANGANSAHGRQGGLRRDPGQRRAVNSIRINDHALHPHDSQGPRTQ